jgi:hypothetical protein
VGASGHGREVAHTYLLNHGAKDFLGFLDDGRSGSTLEGWPIIGKVSDWTRWRDSEFVVGINDPRIRRNVVKSVETLGNPNWGCVIHPNVSIHTSVKIGHGVMILGGVLLHLLLYLEMSLRTKALILVLQLQFAKEYR